MPATWYLGLFLSIMRVEEHICTCKQYVDFPHRGQPYSKGKAPPWCGFLWRTDHLSMQYLRWARNVRPTSFCKKNALPRSTQFKIPLPYPRLEENRFLGDVQEPELHSYSLKVFSASFRRQKNSLGTEKNTGYCQVSFLLFKEKRRLRWVRWVRLWDFIATIFFRNEPIAKVRNL